MSRQVLDGSSPAAEAMIMQDMIEAYAQASETVIKTAVEAGAAAAGTAITAATPYAGIVGNVVEYAGDFFQPAEGQFIPPALFAVAAAQLDGANRPLLANVNPQNSTGGMAADNLGFDVLGARAQVGTNALVEHSVLWEDAAIAPQSLVRHSVLGRNTRASGVVEHGLCEDDGALQGVNSVPAQ